jgi:hypothetical protein
LNKLFSGTIDNKAECNYLAFVLANQINSIPIHYNYSEIYERLEKQIKIDKIFDARIQKNIKNAENETVSVTRPTKVSTVFPPYNDIRGSHREHYPPSSVGYVNRGRVIEIDYMPELCRSDPDYNETFGESDLHIVK